VRASSSLALAGAQERWDPVTRDATDGLELAGTVYAVADLFAANATVRRAVTDPSRSGEDRAALVTKLLGPSTDGRVTDLVSGLARDRWSEDRDVVEALEILGEDTLLATAERQGELETLGEELLSIRSVVRGNPDLEVALADTGQEAPARREFLATVIGSQVSPIALLLAQRGIGTPRTRTLIHALGDTASRAAARRERWIARVTAAIPLTTEQRDRLQAALKAEHGRDVALHVDIDPAIIGGLRVEIGDSVIDGTIRTRLDEASRHIAG
jgi:F-type H+-transporting ATPase subunit delta